MSYVSATTVLDAVKPMERVMALSEFEQEKALSAMKNEVERLRLIIDGVQNSNSAAEDALEKWLKAYPSNSKVFIKRSGKVEFSIDRDTTGYAPKSLRYTACKDDFDPDVLTGNGETPLSAIQDLLDNHIDDLEGDFE